MKMFYIVIGIATGSLAGLFTSMQDDAGLKVVMVCIGMIAGLAFGGAFAGMGKKRQTLEMQADSLEGLGFTPADIARNYWRDQVRPPFTSPLDSEHLVHQFDLDKS